MNYISLSDTTSFIVDNRGKTAPISDTGIPLIATNCINNSDLYPVFKKIRYVTKETYENWFRSHPETDDIIITLKGSQNGAICLVPNPVNFVIAQDMVSLRINKNIIYPYFLFAALRSREVQHQIKTLDVSGVIPHLKKSDFNKIIIPLFDQQSQIKIGDNYFNLCKKIHLLRQQNKTLESMAQTLFKHWFVDFEFPDENGNPYKSSGGAMEASELGEIPKGWRVGCLGDVLNLTYGKALKTEIRNQGKYPVIGSSGIVDCHDSFLVEGPGIVIGRKGTIGKVIWIEKNFYPIDTTFYVANKLKTKLYYHYFILKHQKFNQIGSDSAVPGLNRNLAHGLDLVIPDEIKIKRFDHVISSIWKKKNKNIIQIQTLTSLRDTLLPKLMSGEIEVK